MSVEHLIEVFWGAATVAGIVAGCYIVERLRPSEHDPGVAPRLESLLLFLLNALILAALAPLIAGVVVRLPSLALLGRVHALDWLPAVARDPSRVL